MGHPISDVPLEWKCHTPRLIEEVLCNPSTGILKLPLQMFLGEVATRAAELNDSKLNHLMCRLTLYEVADPYSKEYDQEVIDQVAKEANNG